MKFSEIPPETPDNAMLMIECDITCKLKKTTYGAAKANVGRNGGQYITNWGIAKLNNPMKNQSVKDKIKQTNLERYGATCSMNTPELITERSKKFKDEEWLEQWNEKRRQTCLEKYGVEHQTQAEEVKKKKEQTLLENYGVDNPMKSEIIWEKQRQTVLERYGVDNVAQSPEIRERMYKTTEERYGVKHYNELPEMREYLRKNCREWLAESWAGGGPNKGIPRPEEWSQKQSETVSQMIVDGEWRGSGKKTYQGWYQTKKCKKTKVYWRSGYELMALMYLDDSDDVGFYDYEPFQIPYYDTESKKRHYTVDLLVKYKTQPKSVAIEVKNNYANEEALNKQKYKYFIEMCQEHDLDFEIWKNDKIKSLGYDLQTCLKHERVEVVRRPQ